MLKSTSKALILLILLLCLVARKTAKAIAPVCSAPLYDGAGHITVVCTTNDVYTQASCHFLFQTDGSTETTKLWPPVNTVGPYNTCKLTIPAKNLTAGSHRFKVLMLLTANGIEYEPDAVESSFTSAILIPSSSCHPAEENKSYTLKWKLPSLPDGNTVVWEDQVGPKCTCTAGISVCYCKEGYQGTLFPDGFGGHVSTFVINQVDESHAGTIWTCRNKEAVYSCPLQVYLIPINPICEAPVLHENGSLSITCMADDIYPQAACHFFHKTNGSHVEEMPPTVNMNGPPYNCTLTTVIRQEGIHEFQVKMSPVIGGLEYSRGGLSQSNFTSPVVIESPKVILAEDCPPSGSYVLRNAPVNCSCLRTDFSYLPTTVMWNNADTSDNSNNNIGLLNFTASRNNIDFTCTATNSLGWTSSVDLKLNIAYGPDGILVKANRDNTAHLCGTSVEIQAQCQVPVRNVNPAPIFSFTFNQSETTAPVLGHKENNSYTVTETRKITSGGHFPIGCIAMNSEFKELFGQEKINITITEPPTPPVIEIWQKGATVTVNVSETVLVEDEATITCEAKGGYPSVQDISLAVGSTISTLLQVSNNTDFVSMTVDITREMIGQQIICVVKHPSVCYEKVSKTPPIDLWYPTAKTASDSGSDDEVPIILGVVFGVVGLVLVIAAALLVVYLRKRRGSQDAPNILPTVSALVSHPQDGDGDGNYDYVRLRRLPRNNTDEHENRPARHGTDQGTVPQQSAGSRPHDQTVPTESAESRPHDQTVPTESAESRPHDQTVPTESAESRPHDQTVPTESAESRPHDQTVPTESAESRPKNQTESMQSAESGPGGETVPKQIVESGPNDHIVPTQPADSGLNDQTAQNDFLGASFFDLSTSQA